MLCEQCKAREATVKYVEVVNGVKTEHNLCGQCAAKLDIGQYTALFEGEFSLAQLLSGLLGIQNTEKEEIIYRQISNDNPIPYGMFYKLSDVPEIKNGFFGIPYAN